MVSLPVISLVLAVICSISAQNTRFQERFAWQTLNFQFPDDRTRQNLLNSREYVPISNVPLGIEIWRNRFFVTVPRWLTGIVSTLNYFDFSSNSRSPTLIPYPSFQANYLRPNQTNYNDNIVSVFRLKVDACDRLWFIDTGLIDIIGAYSQVIAPRLFVVDLRTDRRLRTFTFNSSHTGEGTIFGGNMVVDVTPDTCDQAFAYIPDFGTYRLVVYSFEQNQAWRIKHPYFYFDPFASPFYVRGNLFLWTDGIFGAALSALQNDGYRTFYFSSLSSNYLFSVSTRFLRDRTIATNTSTLLEAYRFLGQRGPNMQSSASMLHEPTGTLFYTLVNRNGVGCWNTVRYANNYSPQTNFILATDDQNMIFPNDIIFDDADNIWILSDQLPVSNNGRLNPNEVNFRLFSAPVTQAIRGTICEPVLNTRIGSNETPVFPDKKVGSLRDNIKLGGSGYDKVNTNSSNRSPPITTHPERGTHMRRPTISN